MAGTIILVMKEWLKQEIILCNVCKFPQLFPVSSLGALFPKKRWYRTPCSIFIRDRCIYEIRERCRNKVIITWKIWEHIFHYIKQGLLIFWTHGLNCCNNGTLQLSLRLVEVFHQPAFPSWNGKQHWLIIVCLNPIQS